MKFALTQHDLNKVNHLLEVKNINIAIAEMLQYFFFISEKSEPVHSKEEYLDNLLETCEIDISNPEDFETVEKQIAPYLKQLDENIILNDPYTRCLKIPESKFGEYAFVKQTYQPYQAFAYDDFLVDQEDYREVQKIGYFTKPVEYIALTQNDEVWMSVIPNEIYTHQTPIQNAHGHVVTFGLGMGYFVFNAVAKKEVESLTVVEKDLKIIELFQRLILPQIPQKDKIKIVCEDAYSFMKRRHNFDYAYVDLWHNPNDGLPFYISFKNAEENFSECRFDYWLETSILSLYRRCLLTVIEEQLNGISADAYLKAKIGEDKVVNELYFKTKDLSIKSYQQLHDLLLDESLKKLINKKK